MNDKNKPESIEPAYTLLDVQEMSRKYPEHYKVPSPAELSGLRVGYYARIAIRLNEFAVDGRSGKPLMFFGKHVTGENLWVRVVRVTGNTFLGILETTPVVTPSLQPGDIINFQSFNVLRILVPELDQEIESYISS